MNAYEKKLKELDNRSNKLEKEFNKLSEQKFNYEQHSVDVANYLDLLANENVIKYLEIKDKLESIERILIMLDIQMSKISDKILFGRKKILHK